MTTLREFLSRVTGLVHRGSRDRALAEELQSHIDHVADDLVDHGLPRAEAEAVARRRLGGIDQIKEAYRDQRGWPAVDTLIQDLRFTRRLLATQPGFTMATVLSLAMGIGVSMTFFTLVNGICLRGLPIEQPDRVLYVATLDQRGRPGGVSYGDFADVAREAGGFASLAAYLPAPMTVSDEGQPPDRIAGSYVSAATFATLGVMPIAGRDFTPSDTSAGAPTGVIIGRRLWQSRYGAESSVVGRPVRVNGRAATIVGVMPDGFRFPGQADVWLPLSDLPGIDAEPRTARRYSVFGRLADSAERPGVTANLDAIAKRLDEAHPETNGGITFTNVPINEQFNGRITDTVWLAFITAGALVLLVACGNVAAVLIMRSAVRAREVALRRSLGATRLRIVRQLLIESAVLAGLGGAVGMAFSVAAARLIAWSVPQAAPLPYWIDFSVDTHVLMALVGTCAASVLLFGLVPAVIVSRTGAMAMIKEGGRPAGGQRLTRWWTAGFLAAQFAFTLMLLANVVLSLKASDDETFAGVPIDPAPLFTAQITLPDATYPTVDARRRFLAQLDERLNAVAGVHSATTMPRLALAGAPKRLAVATHAIASGEERPIVFATTVGPRYWTTIGVPILAGRDLDALDGSPDHAAAVVNEQLAATYFPDRDAIGQRIQVTGDDESPRPEAWVTVVGVSANVRQSGKTIPDPMVYLPDRASPPSTLVLLVRATGPIEQLTTRLRETAAAIDPELPLYRLASLGQALREASWNGRLSAGILNSISTIAFLLALGGLYGVTALAVVQRTPEISIRMALGATPTRVAWLVARQALGRVALGLSAGVPLTFAFQRVFGDPSARMALTDPDVLVPVVLTIAAASAAGCLVPALRAARVVPVIALKRE